MMDKYIIKYYKDEIYSITPISKLNKCVICNKDAIIVGFYLNVEDADIMNAGFCRDCFKKQHPDYTLENQCIGCNINLNCDVQELLFSKKEIEQFKEKSIGDARDLELG